MRAVSATGLLAAVFRRPLAIVVAALLAAACGLSWPSPEPDQLLDEFARALREGRMADAEELLQQAESLRPRPARAHWLAADLAEAGGDLDAAVAALNRIGPPEPLAVSAKVRAARIELGRSRATPAERLLTEALAFDPSDWSALRLRAGLYERHGRGPALSDDLHDLAAIQTLTGGEWLAWARAVLGLDPAGDPGERIDDLLPLLDADPEDVRTSMAVADLLRRIGRGAEALNVLIAFHNHVPDVRAARAAILLDSGDLDEAERLLRGGPEEHPATNRLRGELELRRGRPGPALAAFDLAEAFEPGRLDVARGRAATLRLLDRPAEASEAEAVSSRREELARALDRLGDALVDFATLAALAERACQDHLARAGYALALEAHPDDPDLLAALQRLDARLAGISLASLSDPSQRIAPLRPASATK